jgi:hypothetical protein
MLADNYDKCNEFYKPRCLECLKLSLFQKCFLDAGFEVFTVVEDRIYSFLSCCTM